MTSIPRFRIIDPDDWRFPGNVNVVRDKVRARDYYSTHGTYEGAADQIEEFVRQWALDVLITHLGYPAEWIGERIVIEEPVKIGSATTEADMNGRAI